MGAGVFGYAADEREMCFGHRPADTYHLHDQLLMWSIMQAANGKMQIAVFAPAAMRSGPKRWFEVKYHRHTHTLPSMILYSLCNG